MNRAETTPRGAPAATPGGQARRPAPWFAAVYLLLFFSMPALVALIGGDPTRRQPFDPAPLQFIRSYRPRYVLIGNSIMESYINWRTLSRLLSGARVTTLIGWGTESAFLYLSLKNHVLASGVRPRRVFLFFRDNFLTKPRINVGGGAALVLQRAARDREPVLDELLAPRSGRERIAACLARLFPGPPPGRARLALPFIAAARQAELRERVNRRLSWQAMRTLPPAAADDGRPAPGPPAEALDFSRNLADSFLPHIVRLGRESGLRLVFVRARRTPPRGGGPPPQSDTLRRYVADLRAYLQANGMAFYDLTDEPQLRRSMYADADHIALRFQKRATEIFHESVREEWR